MLDDSLVRDYSEKLNSFERFAAPEFRQIVSDLPIDRTSRVLDVGCGTGLVTRILAGRAAFTVGTDISQTHARLAATQAPAARIAVTNASERAFGEHSFDVVWACNSINHLSEPVVALKAIARSLRPGGAVALVQSHLLPEMFFPWDYHLDARVREACHHYYREKYGLDESDTAGSTRILGIAKDAGLHEVEPKTYVIERFAPLSAADREHLQSVFDRYWGKKIRPYLTDEDWAKLERWCDPESGEFFLDRDDFHHLQTITVVTGRRPDTQDSIAC